MACCGRAWVSGVTPLGVFTQPLSDNVYIFRCTGFVFSTIFLQFQSCLVTFWTNESFLSFECPVRAPDFHTYCLHPAHVRDGGACVYSAHCLTIPAEYWKSVPGCTPAKLSCLDRRQTFNGLCGVEKTHPGHSSLHICVPHCLTLKPLLHTREEGGATIYMDGYGLDNVRRM